MATSASKAAPTGPKAVPSPGTGNAGSPGKSRMLLVIAILGVLLLAGAGGAWFYLTKGSDSPVAGNASKAQPDLPPVFMPLETFTVNLQSSDIQQFLQLNLTLQVADETQIELLKTQMPHVRNRLLILLSSQKPSEILSVDGKKKLAADIIAQLKQPFTPQGPEPQISDVLFTSFVVQ
ncbi:flagellar basal body-associated protein FliL [Herbaspirillum sp. GCM10030257]|uniref:flagellar basal body-associated protein FliL n=1 Tax=Herbaspirillum sp. GCM10030257 TaxID=3273393 RepID=UPI0036225A63